MKRNDLFGRNGKGMRLAGLALAAGAVLTAGAAAAEAPSKGPEKQEEAPETKVRSMGAAGVLDPEILILEIAAPPGPAAQPQVFFTNEMLKLYLLWLGVDLDTAIRLGFLEDARLLEMFFADLGNLLRRLGGGSDDADVAADDSDAVGAGAGADTADVASDDADVAPSGPSVAAIAEDPETVAFPEDPGTAVNALPEDIGGGPTHHKVEGGRIRREARGPAK